MTPGHYACWHLPTSYCQSPLQEVSSADRVCVRGEGGKTGMITVEFPVSQVWGIPDQRTLQAESGMKENTEIPPEAIPIGG